MFPNIMEEPANFPLHHVARVIANESAIQARLCRCSSSRRAYVLRAIAVLRSVLTYSSPASFQKRRKTTSSSLVKTSQLSIQAEVKCRYMLASILSEFTYAVDEALWQLERLV